MENDSFYRCNRAQRHEKEIAHHPDYYFPTLAGSLPAGRYLTGAPFDGGQLGAARAMLHVSHAAAREN